MTYGKHGGRGFVSRVRELPRGVAAAGIGLVAAGGLALGLTLSGFAGASIVGNQQVITSNGEAGYYASMNGPGHFTSARTTWYVRKAEQTLGTSSASFVHGIGIQIGSDQTGKVAQLGGLWNTTKCHNALEIEYGSGYLTTKAPDTNGTPVNDGGAVVPTSELNPVLCVPWNDYVKIGLYEVHPGVYEAYAKDLTTGVSISKGFAGVSFPDEAGVGVVADTTNRAGPVTATELANFNSINFTDSNGASGGFFGSSDWSPVGVGSTATGTDGSPFLVAPGTDGGTHYKLYAAAPTGL